MVDLISQVLSLLNRQGFQALPIYHKSSCFDITARGKTNLLFIKCIHNVDNFQKHLKEELKLIADACKGVPLIVAEVNKQSKLQDQVVYETSDIPIITIQTFILIIDKNLFPYVYSKRGGQFVQLDGQKIDEKIRTQGVRRSDLATKIGVQPRSINYYIKGEMDARLEHYRALEKELKSEQLKKPINIFDWTYKGEVKKSPPEEDEELKINLDEQFEQIGLQVLWTKKAPFDGVSDEEVQREVIITGVGKKSDKTKVIHQKIGIIQSISSIINSLRMFVVEDRPIRKMIYEVPVLTMSKLEEIEDKEDLKKIIKREK